MQTMRLLDLINDKLKKLHPTKKLIKEMTERNGK